MKTLYHEEVVTFSVQASFHRSMEGEARKRIKEIHDQELGVKVMRHLRDNPNETFAFRLKTYEASEPFTQIKKVATTVRVYRIKKPHDGAISP